MDDRAPGVLDQPLRDVGPAKTKGTTGTIIRFWPDLSLFADENGVPFTKPQWSTRMIGERFRHKSFVHPGLAFELRDERVAFFVRRLARGRHSVAYRLRAEIPGQYSALPAKAAAMYAPELKANSDEIKLGVGEDGK